MKQISLDILILENDVLICYADQAVDIFSSKKMELFYFLFWYCYFNALYSYVPRGTCICTFSPQGWIKIPSALKLMRCVKQCPFMGLYSLSGKTSYLHTSWGFEAARLNVIIVVSFWNLTGISAALLSRCLSNLRSIGNIQTRISRLRVFTSCGKTSTTEAMNINLCQIKWILCWW